MYVLSYAIQFNVAVEMTGSIPLARWIHDWRLGSNLTARGGGVGEVAAKCYSNVKLDSTCREFTSESSGLTMGCSRSSWLHKHPAPDGQVQVAPLLPNPNAQPKTTADPTRCMARDLIRAVSSLGPATLQISIALVGRREESRELKRIQERRE
jgi:hypothetical protein